jgi:hypothetical protein
MRRQKRASPFAAEGAINRAPGILLTGALAFVKSGYRSQSMIMPSILNNDCELSSRVTQIDTTGSIPCSDLTLVTPSDSMVSATRQHRFTQGGTPCSSGC